MFTYIKLKNFLSFDDVMFDFRHGSRGIKNFISIYGENGSGKSNFVSSIDFLRKSIESFGMNMVLEQAQDILGEMKKNEVSKEIWDLIIRNTSILQMAESCRMIDAEADTLVEYGFRVNDHNGYYILSFRERFVYEKLYYFTGKQSGVLYEIKSDGEETKISFSNKLFAGKKAEDEIKEEIQKYWGKHTFLSIINKERIEKNDHYIEENYLPYVFDLLDMLKDTVVHQQTLNRADLELPAEKPGNLLENLSKGKISPDRELMLDQSEKIVRDFFTQAYADMKDLFYERRKEENEIAYCLYVRKMIGGALRTIPFSRESAGTKRILEILRFLLGAFCGVTVVYDEIDNGIHDLLLKNILESMADEITGQLIITTHNTYLLESMNIRSVYLIQSDYAGKKEVKCLDQYPRIQSSNNPRNMYMKGMFGGVPIVDVIDYDEIRQELDAGFPDEEGGG